VYPRYIDQCITSCSAVLIYMVLPCSMALGCIVLHCMTLSVTGQEVKESLKKEILDMKRSLTEESFEKDAVQKTSAELRNRLKKTEAEKVELSQQIQEMRQRLNSKLSSKNIVITLYCI